MTTSLSGRTILVVEDQPEVLSLLVDALPPARPRPGREPRPVRARRLLCAHAADQTRRDRADGRRLQPHGDGPRARVGNAIKFTAEGEVRVEVRVAQRSETDLILHAQVSDSGIGIAADKQASIFEPFIQADSSTTRRHGARPRHHAATRGADRWADVGRERAREGEHVSLHRELRGPHEHARSPRHSPT